MTDLTEARNAVYLRFLDEWKKQDLTPLTAFCLDNETLEPDVPPVWARCSVRSMPNTQETLGRPGNRKYKRQALARVEVYVPPGKGMEDVDALVLKAMSLFEGRHLIGTSVKFYEASSAEVGLVNQDRWHLSTVQAYFNYEEIR